MAAAHTGFDWDEHNVAHIARHRVTPAEIEQVFANSPFLLSWHEVRGEYRFNHVGETDAERLIEVIWTPRLELHRVITAWPIGRRSRIRTWYFEQKKETEPQ